MEYTVKALADLAGVTPRTLRWYDRIGLLKPLRTTEAGYRLYGPAQLDRLQDILFYRPGDNLSLGVERMLYIKLLGQCAGCPSADLTNETLIEHELTAALPELVQKVVVVQTVSDELWEQAKRLLRDHHL